MRLMLDTQMMLCWLRGDQRLRQETRELMATSACAVSVDSVWEVAIKHRIGKLPIDPATFRNQIIAVGAALLSINYAHAIETARLPGVHEDPFDRLIIAQVRIDRVDGGVVRWALKRVRRRVAASVRPRLVWPVADRYRHRRMAGRRRQRSPPKVPVRPEIAGRRLRSAGWRLRRVRPGELLGVALSKSRGTA